MTENPLRPVTPESIQESRSRSWSMLCHLSALSGYIFPLGWVLGPLLVWQIKKDEFPTIVEHGHAAINFQISMMVYALISWILSFVLIGIPMLLAVGLLSVVGTVLGALKANQGVVYKYPLSIQFFK